MANVIFFIDWTCQLDHRSGRAFQDLIITVGELVENSHGRRQFVDICYMNGTKSGVVRGAKLSKEQPQQYLLLTGHFCYHLDVGGSEVPRNNVGCHTSSWYFPANDQPETIKSVESPVLGLRPGIGKGSFK